MIPAALIQPLSPAPPPGDGPQAAGLSDGWLGQYLRDPLGTLLAVLVPIEQWLAIWWPTVLVRRLLRTRGDLAAAMVG